MRYLQPQEGLQEQCALNSRLLISRTSVGLLGVPLVLCKCGSIGGAGNGDYDSTDLETENFLNRHSVILRPDIKRLLCNLQECMILWPAEARM